MNFKQSTIFSIAASLGLIIFNMLINVIESRVLGPSESDDTRYSLQHKIYLQHFAH